MKLLFKQRMFSWFDSYDIFDENGETVYTVKGQFAWGRCLKIFDTNGNEAGTLKQKVFSMMPTFQIFLNNEYVGCIKRAFSPFKPKFDVDCKGWSVTGNFTGWEYEVVTESGAKIAQLSKEIFRFTDTYSIDVVNPDDALSVLMIALAIDADKASHKNSAAVVSTN